MEICDRCGERPAVVGCSDGYLRCPEGWATEGCAVATGEVVTEADNRGTDTGPQG